MAEVRVNLSPDHHRALAILIENPGGCTEDLLSAHGFPAKIVAELVKAKLVTTELVARMVAGHMITVTQIKITEAARMALRPR